MLSGGANASTRVTTSSFSCRDGVLTHHTHQHQYQHTSTHITHCTNTSHSTHAHMHAHAPNQMDAMQKRCSQQPDIPWLCEVATFMWCGRAKREGEGGRARNGGMGGGRGRGEGERGRWTMIHIVGLNLPWYKVDTCLSALDKPYRVHSLSVMAFRFPSKGALSTNLANFFKTKHYRASHSMASTSTILYVQSILPTSMYT